MIFLFRCTDGFTLCPQDLLRVLGTCDGGRQYTPREVTETLESYYDDGFRGGQLYNWLVMPERLFQVLCQAARIWPGNLDVRRMADHRDAIWHVKRMTGCGSIGGLRRARKADAEQEEHLRRCAERMRRIGILRYGRQGIATRIYAAPPRWDGFGAPPSADLTVYDDGRPYRLRYDDHDMRLAVFGLHQPTVDSAFGSPGRLVSFARI